MNIDTKVYMIVAKIPTGYVMTYGSIAKKLNMKSPRLVGKILHKNNDPIKVPCHRVVFSDGKLSINYAYGGYEIQKQKLINEGVIFINQKVNLKLCNMN